MISKVRNVSDAKCILFIDVSHTMILHRIIKQIYVDILKLAVQILITVYSYYLDKGTR